MDKQISCFVFGIQFLAVVSILLGSVFLVGFSGGLDLIGYDFPGFSETLFMLPIVFPFTVLTYAINSRLKNQTVASLMVIIVLIANVVLAFEVVRLLRELLSWLI